MYVYIYKWNLAQFKKNYFYIILLYKVQRIFFNYCFEFILFVCDITFSLR